MTISAMRLVAAGMLVAAAVPGCGSGSAGDDADAALRRAERAQAAADRSLDAVHELEAEVDSLTERLHDAHAQDEAIRDRLDGVTKRLWDSIARARAGASDAAGSASSALATAQSAARDLAVLSKRLDYHLQQSGG